MKYINNFKLIIPIFLLLLSSCVSQKKLIYLQNKDKSTIKNEFINERNEYYKVQPGDNLFIQISSFNPNASGVFSTSQGTNITTNNTDAGIYLNSYTVTKEGAITFPIIGTVMVKDLAVEEIKGTIKTLLDEYIKEAMVTVKLVNFNVTLLGEIRRPGQYKVYQGKINLLEAIAMAGDLKDFGNRHNIKLIRQSKKGSVIRELDITNQDFLESEFLFLMPNDIIYIEPLKGKQFAFANFPYGIVFSSISTLVLLLSFIK